MTDVGWRTVRVVDAPLARSCLGRLHVWGIEYHVIADDGLLRILVRSERFAESMDLLAETDRHQSPRNRRFSLGLSYRQNLRLIVAMPLGGLAGSVVAFLLGLPPSSISAVSAGCASLAAFLAVAAGRPTR